MDLTEAAINKILELAKPERLEIDGTDYATKPYFPVIFPNYPEQLNITTLTGIVDYIKPNVDGNEKINTFLVVSDYNCVRLVSSLDNLNGRSFYLQSTAIDKGFQFNSFHEPDMFIIGIQSQFKDSENTYPIRSLLEYVSAIKSAKVDKVTDDGISQTTHLESKITGGALITIPGPTEPILLKPFRTFREIDQPESLFQLRMDGGGGRPPKIALYEADGQAWKIDAIRKIKEWLEAKIDSAVVIA